MRRRLADSRSAACRAIDEGRVRVTGVAEPKAATLVAPSAAVTITDPSHEWASRGGHKLDGALNEFAVDVTGRIALDVGASTGGFTDVLLAHGASTVTAIDVGYGQLVWRLRQDPRVTVIDRTNFRHVDVAEIGAPFDLVVVDVSFISVAMLTERLAEAGHAGTDYIVLVKPQFEVGKGRVGKGGIVSEPSLHRSAIEQVATALEATGLGVVHLTRSPIEGAKGNREFFLHLRPGPAADLSAKLVEVTAP